MDQKIYFTDSKGVKLCGVLSDPTGDKARPIIILCHGFTTSKDSFTTVKLEEILNKNGISTLRFDFFGHGESGGDFAEITISEGVDDILRAIEYLKGLGYSKMGLVGSSFGGICSIMAASKTDDLYLLALKSPVSNYEEMHRKPGREKAMADWKEKGYRDHMDSKRNRHKLNYSFFEDAAKNDGYVAAAKIKIPTLIVHGNDDLTVPITQSAKTSQILPDGKLEIIEGANHHYSGVGHFDRMIELISNFIIRNS